MVRKRLLLDTNIVIDALARRKPFCESAGKLLILGKLGEFKLYISSSQITDVFYVLSGGGEKTEAPAAKERLRSLREGVDVSALSGEDIGTALASTWPDFEDACVYQAAMRVKADCIITRNGQDFANSSIPVFSCEDFFAWYEHETGITYSEIGV